MKPIYIVIIALLIAGGSYLLLNDPSLLGDSQAPATPSPPVANENPKTYQGPGFELTIPSGWEQNPENSQQIAQKDKDGYYINFNKVPLGDINDAKLKELYRKGQFVDAEMRVICGNQACATTLDSHPIALAGALGIEFTLRYVNTPTNEVPISSIEELHRVFIKNEAVYRFWTSNITWVDKSRVLDPDPFIVFRQILDTIKIQ